MTFALLLLRDPGTRDVDAWAQRVSDDFGVGESEGVVPWSAGERAALLRELRAADRRIVASEGDADDDEDGVFLSTETQPGVDYDLEPTALLADIELSPRDSVAATRLLGDTLDALERVAHAQRLLAFCPAIGRVVDLRRDRAAIEAAYRTACERVAKSARDRAIVRRVAIVGFIALSLLVVMVFVVFR